MANKAKRTKNKLPTNHELVISFSEILSGKQHVVAGCVSSMERAKSDKQKRKTNRNKVPNEMGYEPKKKSSYTFCKAADIELNSRHKIALTEARVEAVSRFLKKAKPIDSVKVYTDDACLLSPLMSVQTQEQWNELREKFAKFSIHPTSSDQKNAMELVQKAIAFKINDLSKNNKESKGYVDRHVMTAGRG